MRLVIAEGDKEEVTLAMNHVDTPVSAILLNPTWLPVDYDDPLWIACGAPAVKQLQSAGWLPKKGGVEALRGRLFTAKPDGWEKPLNIGVTYNPQIRSVEYEKFVAFQADLSLYRRFELTGSIDPVLGHYTYTHDLSGVINYLKAVHEVTGEEVTLALDTETEGLDPFNPEKRIVCIQASAKEGIADVVYTYSMSWAYIQENIIPQLQWIAEQPWVRVIGANFKYDMLWLRVKWGIVFKNFRFDTCNGGSLVEENRANTLSLHTKIYSPELGGYDAPLERVYDKSDMGSVPKADLLPYAGGDTDACLRNYRKIRKEILSDNLNKSGKPARNSIASVYLNIIHPALMAVHRMEHEGFLVDVDKFHAFGADLKARMIESKIMAAKMLPKKLLDQHGGLDEDGGAPLSKPSLIANALFSPSGMNLPPIQTTTKTGKPSTSEYHLSQFKDHPEAGPLIERYLDYVAVSKMFGTYYEGFLEHLRHDNRWHASYIIHKQGKSRGQEQNAGGAVTGRASAVDPAFQCVSGETEIMTSLGMFRADALIDPLVTDPKKNPFAECDITLTSSVGWVKASNVFKSWRADLVQVLLAGGTAIRCTPEHPLLVRRHSGVRYKKPVWIKASELAPGDCLAPNKTRIERIPAPVWITDEVATSLGILAVCGVCAATLPVIYIEVPKVHSGAIIDALDSFGVGAVLDEVDGKAVLSFSLDTANPKLLEFVLALPTEDDARVPRGIRGTQAWYPFFKGLVLGSGATLVGPPHRRGFSINTRTKAMARVLMSEAAMDGLPMPFYRAARRGVTYRHGASVLMDRWGDIGLLTSMRTEPELRERLFENPEYLEVVYLASAPPGWVYDFTVPRHHEFLANGLISHNTVPKHSYWGKRLRECMIAPPGHILLGRDYSQGELKVAACWAFEQRMIEAYQNNIDLHVLTAGTVAGYTYEQALALKTSDPAAYGALRQRGKAGNFGLLYGMTAYGFMMYADAVYGVKLTLEEATAMRDAFFDLYPGLLLWHIRQIGEAEHLGFVRSPLGRKRHLPLIHSPIQEVAKKARNQAVNSPIQATLADLMWISMGMIEEHHPDLLAACGSVHDQGLWYVPEDDLDEAIKVSGDIMENLPLKEKFGWEPQLKFTTDAEVGLSLGAMKAPGQ